MSASKTSKVLRSCREVYGETINHNSKKKNACEEKYLINGKRKKGYKFSCHTNNRSSEGKIGLTYEIESTFLHQLHSTKYQNKSSLKIQVSEDHAKSKRIQEKVTVDLRAKRGSAD